MTENVREHQRLRAKAFIYTKLVNDNPGKISVLLFLQKPQRKKSGESLDKSKAKTAAHLYIT